MTSRFKYTLKIHSCMQLRTVRIGYISTGGREVRSRRAKRILFSDLKNRAHARGIA